LSTASESGGTTLGFATQLAQAERRRTRQQTITLLSRRLWQLRAGVIGGLFVVSMIFIAFFAPLVAPHDPYEQDIIARLTPPVWAEGGSADHILGTDKVGRDVLSRIIFGSRVSLTVGAVAVGIAATIGVLLGLLGGYYSGRVDTIVSGAVNLMLAFPFMLLALATVAVLGPSFQNMIIVLGVTGWPIYTRVVRSEALRLRETEFVTAARALGASDARIIIRHLLPNLYNALIVMASLEVARMILLESFLSFLGLGVQPPTPAWGSLLAEGRTYIFDMWWLATFPGLAIFVTTLGINLMGDAIRDFLDPRMKNVV
jgi:ABC-type dipeptide/oligopeptide/nickel transport system permease subunit